MGSARAIRAQSRGLREGTWVAAAVLLVGSCCPAGAGGPAARETAGAQAAHQTAGGTPRPPWSARPSTFGTTDCGHSHVCDPVGARSVSGLVSPGTHLLEVELTFRPYPPTPYGYDYALRAYNRTRFDVPASGTRVRVRSSRGGSITTPIERSLVVDVRARAIGGRTR